MRFPAFRLIVKVIEQAAFQHEQRVALEWSLWNEKRKEKKKRKRLGIDANERVKGRMTETRVYIYR